MVTVETLVGLKLSARLRLLTSSSLRFQFATVAATLASSAPPAPAFPASARTPASGCINLSSVQISRPRSQFPLESLAQNRRHQCIEFGGCFVLKSPKNVP